MRNTIKKHEHFLPHDDDPLARMPIFIVRATPTRFPGDARYGLITSKKAMKFATDRNRARRLIRAWLAECSDLMNPDMDYVIIARRDILETGRDAGVAMLRKAIKKLGISDL